MKRLIKKFIKILFLIFVAIIILLFLLSFLFNRPTEITPDPSLLPESNIIPEDQNGLLIIRDTIPVTSGGSNKNSSEDFNYDLSFLSEYANSKRQPWLNAIDFKHFKAKEILAKPHIKKVINAFNSSVSLPYQNPSLEDPKNIINKDELVIAGFNNNILHIYTRGPISTYAKYLAHTGNTSEALQILKDQVFLHLNLKKKTDQKYEPSHTNSSLLDELVQKGSSIDFFSEVYLDILKKSPNQPNLITREEIEMLKDVQEEQMQRTLKTEYALALNALHITALGTFVDPAYTEIVIDGKAQEKELTDYTTQAFPIINYYLFDPQKTTELFSNFYHDAIAGNDLKKYNYKLSELSPFTPNLVGIVFFNELKTNPATLKRISKKNINYLIMADLVVALRDYYADHSDLPDKLSDLKPDYISSIPKRSSGEDFYYDKNLLGWMEEKEKCFFGSCFTEIKEEGIPLDFDEIPYEEDLSQIIETLDKYYIKHNELPTKKLCFYHNVKPKELFDFLEQSKDLANIPNPNTADCNGFIYSPIYRCEDEICKTKSDSYLLSYKTNYPTKATSLCENIDSYKENSELPSRSISDLTEEEMEKDLCRIFEVEAEDMF